MAEHIETLTCPRGHDVEVHWEDGQQASHWQCPECLDDPNVSADESLVPFDGGTR